MLKNKIITLSTIALLTLGYTIPTINVLATESNQSLEYDNKDYPKTVGTVEVNFKDTLGNNLATINKTNILKGKKFELIETNLRKDWKIISDLPSGVLDKDLHTYDITVAPNKSYNYTVQYITPTKGIVKTDTYVLEHGAVVTFDFPEETEDYIKISEDNFFLVVGDNDLDGRDRIVSVHYDTKHFATDDNGNQVPIYKDFSIDKVDYSVDSYAFTRVVNKTEAYNEEDMLLDITPENYNYEYKDVFDTINNNDLYPKIKKLPLNQNNYLDYTEYFDKLTLYAKAKDYLTFTEYYGEATNFYEGKKLVELTEILDHHNIPQSFISDAVPFQYSLNVPDSTLNDLNFESKIEDLLYGMVGFGVSLPKDTQKYLDYEINTLSHDMYVTFDTPINFDLGMGREENKEYLDMKKLDRYPRFFETMKESIVGKRIALISPGRFDIMPVGFADIYEQDGQFRLKVYLYNHTFTTYYDYNSSAMMFNGAIRFDLNSKVTINYVAENGDLLDTYTQIYDKNSKFTLENKTFEGYELVNSSDKNKEIVANKDFSVDIVYKKVTPEVTPEIEPELTPEVTPEIEPELTPEVTPEIEPKLTPEVTPEIEPELTPEVTPEVTPEIITPEAPESIEEQDTLHKTGQLNEGIRLPDLSMFYVLIILIVMGYFLFLV